jgi:protein-L-isoaspartate(D-aspartate) O-methyltransferase
MNALNVELARHNMVESQVRTWDVTDARVLALLARAPREDYVPAPYRALAYVDMAIPLGHGQTMLHPKLEARLLQALAIRPQDKILEVGTGSGYMTSLLAALGAHVVSVEIFPELAQEAARKLEAHGVKNVTLEVGDAANGWSRSAPYDVILLTGSVPVLPASFAESLAPHGRLLAIVGSSPAMEVRLLRRLDGALSTTSLFETDVPPLVNAPAPSAFRF